MIRRVSILIALFFTCFNFSLVAQTFLNKKLIISGGTSLVVPVLGQEFNNKVFQADYDWTIAPSEIELDLGWAFSSKGMLQFSSSFRPLRNSSYNNHDSAKTTDYREEHLDTFFMKSNAINFGLGVRLFDEFSPVGRYFQFGLNVSNISANVNAQLITKRSEFPFNDIEEVFEVNNLPEWSESRLTYGLYFGRGVSKLLSESSLVDFGIKCNWYFGSKRYSNDYDPFVNKYDYDYQKHFRNAIRSVMLANLQSSYLFSIYLKIGLLK